MRELAGHRVNEANEQIQITATDDPGSGGANHRYEIKVGEHSVVMLDFQNGPIKEVGVNGVTQEALLEICADRLRSFQSGQYACRENALALTKLEEAQLWLQKRTLDRLRRGVEGTHEK